MLPSRILPKVYMTSRIQKEEWQESPKMGVQRGRALWIQRQQQEQTALFQSRKVGTLVWVSVVCASPTVPGTLVTRRRADALLWESSHRQEKLRPKIPRFAFPTKAAASDLSWPAHTGVPYLAAAQCACNKTLLGNEWIYLAPPQLSVLTSPR